MLLTIYDDTAGANPAVTLLDAFFSLQQVRSSSWLEISCKKQKTGDKCGDNQELLNLHAKLTIVVTIVSFANNVYFLAALSVRLMGQCHSITVC